MAEPMSRKDWLSIAISLVALAVSFLAAYYSSLRQIDDLRMIVDEAPSLHLSDDKRSIYLNGKLSLTFLNVGTRPAVIKGVWFSIAQPQLPFGLTEDSCRVTWDTDLEPFILKEREIARKTLGYRPPPGVNFPGAEIIELATNVSGANRARSINYETKFCIGVAASTPSNGSIRTSSTVDVFTIYKEVTDLLDSRDEKRPITIWRKSGLVFLEQ